MSNIIDITGQTFGYLTVLSRAPNLRTKGEACWWCRCACGEVKAFRSDKLRTGRTRSCGCSNPIKITHGMSHSPEYVIWRRMHARCYNPRCVSYKNYGGRGIKVRFASFEEFFAEVGPRPDGLSIDRMDNNGHYEPGNVRWATSKEQSNNKRAYPKSRKTRKLKLRTHCSYGHELTDDNVYLGARGSRRCAQCARQYDKEYRARRKR